MVVKAVTKVSVDISNIGYDRIIISINIPRIFITSLRIAEKNMTKLGQGLVFLFGISIPINRIECEIKKRKYTNLDIFHKYMVNPRQRRVMFYLLLALNIP